MKKFPWFRLYASDLMGDKKFKRIHKLTGISLAEIRGVWLSIMCLANDSPKRGKLLFDGGEPYDYEDLAEDSGIDSMKFHTIFQHFTTRGMIATDGEIYYLPNWGKRQPISDTTGAERTKKWRQNRKKTVTSPKRHSDALESEEESESEEGRRLPAFTEPYIRDFVTGITGLYINLSIDTMGNIKKMLDRHGEEKVFKAMSSAFDGWCNTKSDSTGQKYSPYNTAWIDWGVEYLVTGNMRWEDTKKEMTTQEKLIAAGYQPS